MSGLSHLIARLGKPARPGLLQALGCQLPVREQPASAPMSEFGISESTAASQASSLTPFYYAV